MITIISDQTSLGLRDSLIGDKRRIINLFAEFIEHFLAIVVEFALDFVDRLILNDPQLTRRVSDQSFVVRNDDDAT